jgi:hypothetical protein
VGVQEKDPVEDLVVVLELVVTALRMVMLGVQEMPELPEALGVEDLELIQELLVIQEVLVVLVVLEVPRLQLM